MAELSTFVTSLLLEWLESHSVAGADWAADICDPEDLVEPDGHIDWEIFSQLCDRLANYSEEAFDPNPLLPTPAEIGREVAEELFSASPTRIRASDVPIEILFIEESISLANDLFPELEVRADIASDGNVILLEIELPADCSGCPAFFELIKGALEVAPLLLEQDPVEVAVEVHPEFARYAVEIPSGVGQLISLDSESELDTLLDAESETEERQIPQRVDFPRDPPQLEGEPSFDHDGFIRSLAACSDIDEVGRHLFALLDERFDCVAARVWLDVTAEGSITAEGSADDPPDAPRLEFGESVKPPDRSLRLGVGATPLGRIDLWDSDGFGDEQLESLENLLPWYSLSFKALAEQQIPTLAFVPADTAIPTQPAGKDEIAETELQHRRDLEEKRAGNARNRSLIETSHDLCAELSPDHGLLEISENVHALLGYTPAAFIATPYRELVHPDDLPIVTELYREVQHEDASVSASVRIRHADGGWCWLEAQAQSYRAQNGEVRVIVSARDITEHATLEQEHAQMVSIIQNSADLIVVTALNGTVLFLNIAGQRIIGLASDEEAHSKSLYDFVHEDAKRALKFEIMPAVHRHKAWTGELILQHFKTQKRVTALTNMFVVDDRRTRQPVAIAMICRDISDHRQNERALLESEERYRMLADNPYDLIAELDEHARFIYASPNFETILGYSPELLLGSPGIDIIHPEDRESVMRGLTSTLAELATRHSVYRALHRDGSYRWLETTMRAYQTPDSKVIACMISRDITEKVESNEALRQSEQKLQQSQKMEAIGRMAGGIAHDFNNLLTAITGYCDLLLEELGAQHPARTDAEEILKASERAAQLTHQLLAFSRRQVLQPRILDLNNLVADMDRMLRRLIGEDVELVTLLDGAAWPIKADPGQLQQVLMNLVVNARDAMPRGGRLTIETVNTTLDDTVASELGDIPAGEYLTLSVSDNGTGMTEEIRAMIFEPFFTTKESGKGTGLGLSTVIGIVQQSGGHIEVESEDGRGACFVIYLPKATEVPMLPERYLSPGQFRGSETVVVVEDSEPVRKLVVRCLDRHGYTVLEAVSGVDALRFFSRHPEPIHLLLSDVILPKMDGFEIFKRAREIRPEIRVIYMSGFTDEALSEHGVRAEDITLLEKPFTPSTLLRKIREFLDTDPERGPGSESLTAADPRDDSQP